MKRTAFFRTIVIIVIFISGCFIRLYGAVRFGMAADADTTIPVGVIELRNYVLKHGMRDRFIAFFEKHFVSSQEALGSYIPARYRVKGAPDNFFWVRGFRNMKERGAFLPAFYYGDVWKEHKATANPMLANNDNVYLLRPLSLQNHSLVPATAINVDRLVPPGGITVIEYYTANTRLNELLTLFAREYLPLVERCGDQHYSVWTSVLEQNDFPRLPVFQDKNLLMKITMYKSEEAYEKMKRKIAAALTPELKDKLRDVITVQRTEILYPTDATIQQNGRP